MQQRRGPGSRHILGGPRPRSPVEELQGFHIDSEDPLVGKTIHNKYKITRKIGGGGMGTIYRAIDQTGSVVALKVIGADMTTKEDMRTRFMLEAEAATVVNHPNVIEVTEIGTFSNRVFCVMEYLEGQDLSKLLRKEKRLGWDQFKPLMLQICGGVAAAHDCKIIHRDLKPANIFLIDRNGRDFVKVLDFGLAKFKDSKEEGITLSGTFLGTTSYAAPEQARGSKDLDNRVDIYALGIIMYEMLTGKVPFKGETPIATLQMHINDVPRRPTELNPSIPRDVEAVIMKALQKKREDRFQS
ncbi:serine/threonine protein kinase, partial [Candidatus Micrarchaeota archaeon]|nr:serine/threonine protein kinase [Candidatus Micrarchaeota archaeon]